MTPIERWGAAWAALGLRPPAGGAFAALVAGYGEPARAYHNLRHVEECFEQLDAARPDVREPGEVALALWFHDAIYDPTRGDNEDRSADRAASVLGDAGATAAAIGRVRASILATDHREPPPPGDPAAVVDADLAILAASADRFDEYEAQVRAEYGWVGDAEFRAGRAGVLRRFLDRGSIYSTAAFRDRLEGRARANLARSLARLREG